MKKINIIFFIYILNILFYMGITNQSNPPAYIFFNIDVIGMFFMAIGGV